jgi:hypothetical protein
VKEGQVDSTDFIRPQGKPNFLNPFISAFLQKMKSISPVSFPRGVLIFLLLFDGSLKKSAEQICDCSDQPPFPSSFLIATKMLIPQNAYPILIFFCIIPKSYISRGQLALQKLPREKMKTPTFLLPPSFTLPSSLFSFLHFSPLNRQ